MIRVCLFLMLFGGVAVAQPAKSRTLKKAADQAFLAGDLEQALALLDQAYAAHPDPGLIANQGVVLERLGENAKAAEAFERFLATRPAEAKARKAREILDRLKPTVRVESDPPGVRVQLVGAEKALGLTPLSTRLLVGHYEFELSRPGYAPWRGTLDVVEGRAAVLRGALQKLVSEAPTSPTVRATTPPPATSTDHLLWGGVTAGAGLVVAGAGVYLLSAASDEVDARDAARSRTAWDDHQSSAETFNTSAWIAIGAGVAAMTGGALMMALGGEDAGVSVGPTGGHAWVSF